MRPVRPLIPMVTVRIPTSESTSKDAQEGIKEYSTDLGGAFKPPPYPYPLRDALLWSHNTRQDARNLLHVTFPKESYYLVMMVHHRVYRSLINFLVLVSEI